jgi:hypothetical protein
MGSIPITSSARASRSVVRLVLSFERQPEDELPYCFGDLPHRDQVPQLEAAGFSRTRILIPTKASITTAVAWIAIVNTMIDKPQSQPGWSNISIERVPRSPRTSPADA